MPKATAPSPGTDPNPSGICGCGCGRQTSIVKWSDKTKGLVKGHHRLYLSGHHRAVRRCAARGCKATTDIVNGYCTKHYQRFRKYGADGVETLPPSPRGVVRPCIVDGCPRTTKAASGLCAVHYTRNRKHGTTELQPHWATTERRDEIVTRIAASNKGKVRTAEHRAAVSRAQKGKVLTPQHRAAIGAAHRGTKRPPMKPETHAKLVIALAKGRAVMRNRKGPTRLELAARSLLAGLGVEFIEQHPIGCYTVDFFIPKIGCVVEADGSYWHQSEAKERARDAYLLRDTSVRSIVHLDENQLKPWTMNRVEWETHRRAILAA